MKQLAQDRAIVGQRIRDEQGLCQETGALRVAIDPRYYRPAEVDLLIGDPTKAKTVLGWEPRIGVRELVCEMVASDLASLRGHG